MGGGNPLNGGPSGGAYPISPIGTSGGYHIGSSIGAMLSITSTIKENGKVRRVNAKTNYVA